MDTITIAIADDLVLFSKSLSALVKDENDINVVFIAENGQELLNKLERVKTKPDIIIMDISMPVLDGIEASRLIKEKYPQIKIIIVSMLTEKSYLNTIMDLEVEGYINKACEPLEFFTAIRSVYNNRVYYGPEVAEILVSQYRRDREITVSKNSFKNMTNREIEVLGLLCSARTSEEISKELNISELTVCSHRNNILRKTNSRNIVALVIKALKQYVINIDNIGIEDRKN